MRSRKKNKNISRINRIRRESAKCDAMISNQEAKINGVYRFHCIDAKKTNIERQDKNLKLEHQ